MHGFKGGGGGEGVLGDGLGVGGRRGWVDLGVCFLGLGWRGLVWGGLGEGRGRGTEVEEGHLGWPVRFSCWVC